MSEEELDQGTLRILKERSEAKKVRTVLENEIRRAGRALIELGSPLSTANGSDSADLAVSVLHRHSELLKGSKLEGMIREYASLCHKILELDQRVRQLGMD